MRSDAPAPAPEEPRPAAGASRIVVHPVVFGVSSVLVLLFSVFGAGFPQLAATVFASLQGGIIDAFGWFYMLAVAIFLAFALFLGFSRFGDIRLGPDDSVPDYSRLSWFAMLFSAGVGIGLLFFGVSEPLLHFADPPVTGLESRSPLAARGAMSATFLHWGVHAWAIYIVMGLSLAYFAYRHDLPLTIRSALHPLIGERIHGPIGNIVDIAAVLGTVFGVATSLGLGVLQINAGLGYLFEVPETALVQILLIAAITAMATVSVVAGLDAGIKRLSELNMVLAVALLLFVFVVGPTSFLMSAWLQNIGSYASDLVNLTFRQFAYQPTEWLGAWTLFYWSWWIAWAPFVGMFIARISRGRTIREFVLGVMAVPSLFIFFWMTVFGDTAIHGVLDGRMEAVMAMAHENMPLTLFVMLEQFPFPLVTSVAAIVLIVTFFVTSSDSGSLVVDMITSGGADDPPVWQRVFWAVTQGVVAAVLLVAGGLGALQTAALTSGLPLAVVMLFISAGLYTALSREHFERTRYPAPALPVARARRHWRQRLESLVRHHDRAAVQKFIDSTARPAFESVAMELRTHGVDAILDEEDDRLVLRVLDGEAVVFEYGVTACSYRTPAFAFVESRTVDRQSRHWLAEAWCSATGERYDVLGLERESLIDDLLASYSRWIGGSIEALRGELVGRD